MDAEESQTENVGLKAVDDSALIMLIRTCQKTPATQVTVSYCVPACLEF